MRDVYRRTVILMDTVVTIQVVGHGEGQQQSIERQESVGRAFALVSPGRGMLHPI